MKWSNSSVLRCLIKKFPGIDSQNCSGVWAGGGAGGAGAVTSWSGSLKYFWIIYQIPELMLVLYIKATPE